MIYEQIFYWTGWVLWQVLFTLFIVAGLGLIGHIVLNQIFFNKEARGNLYYYLQHKKEIVEYIKNKVKK